MRKSILTRGLLGLCIVPFMAANAQTEINDTVTSRTVENITTYKVVKNQSGQEQFSNTYQVAPGEKEQNIYPCPFGWTVKPNPSVDNSLSYLSSDSKLAISVTSLEKTRGVDSTAEAYARVAALQMNCALPVRSNLIEGAWSFECSDENVETIIYGEPGSLAMLVISGRNPDTEASVEEFIKFLDSQS
ncbi:hypothetical protein SAMN02910357_00232 [Succinivibrio dextrinosolvens]|uniref:hypothetical protein n=1 Tax=Succinivibrio dextrinosolvens TaxID=83771 RepID=UPI0008E20AD8|nr:hypothetical protein [Succinivibrio dextrinosolvens]SFS34401.1 hypothetical protein SAMN02910357_00232 [Succinivibrio dextrinosolvens]